MTQPKRAVFLSYASQDAEAARRICDSLRSAGIEVWFDQSELRGGDAWDAAIRRQIKSCALFIPIISKNTQARDEGYFRLEWKLAVDRSYLMTTGKTFLLPIVVDDLRDDDEHVPDKFREVQWTRLPAGQTPPGFVERVSRLLSADPVPALMISQSFGDLARLPQAATTGSDTVSAQYRSSGRPQIWLIIVACVAIGLLGFWLYQSKHADAARPQARVTQQAASASADADVPGKSIAVLPFVDMSEKKDQEYFSDGLTEELIDLLAKTQGLEVIARTSSFYFKGKQATIGEIAKTLNVSNVMEGSVRKAGTTIRVTAQLIRARDGVHIWSETYDRDLQDVFKVQEEIARGVVDKLKLTLLAAAPAAPSVTSSAEAHGLYLQGRYFKDHDTSADLAKATDCFERALALDATYAPAWAGIASVVVRQVANGYVTLEEGIKNARAAALKALQYDPKNGEALAALGTAHMMAHEWPQADATLASGRQVDPANSALLMTSAIAARGLGRDEESLALFRQALERDPLNLLARRYFARTLFYAGRLPDAEAEIRQVLDMNPMQPGAHYELGRILLAKGETETAVAAFEAESDASWRAYGLPLGLHAQRRTAEANAALATLLRQPAQSEFQIAETYAYFGDADLAFQWLDAAAQRDIGIIWLHNDPLFTRLTLDPRYGALLRKLHLQQ